MFYDSNTYSFPLKQKSTIEDTDEVYAWGWSISIDGTIMTDKEVGKEAHGEKNKPTLIIVKQLW